MFAEPKCIGMIVTLNWFRAFVCSCMNMCATVDSNDIIYVCMSAASTCQNIVSVCGVCALYEMTP